MDGNTLPLTILAAYAAVGAVIYIIYGFWHSKLAKGIDITEETTMSSPAEAMGSGVDNQKD
jgi:APA family basic amino acid/polyamine antiporter